MFLDPAQLAVLALPEGRSAAVIGAPGSGKTTLVVELVRDRIRHRGYTPAEVLVLAATRASATRLRDRIGLRVGVPTNGPLARTGNSLAFQIVRGASTDAENPVLLTGGEQDQIIAELLAGHLEDGTGPSWPDPLTPEVRGLRGFRTELRDLMSRCTEYGVSPARLAGLGRELERPEWVAAAEFLREYEMVTDAYRSRAFDSASLAQEAAATVLEAPAGAAASATLGSLATLKLLIVDDAQELTRSTLALLRRFAERGVAIVAVGDPDVSTGSFRGSHPDALGRLAHHLALDSVDTIVLDTVHRHGSDIRSIVAAVSGRIGTAGTTGRHRRAGAAEASDAALDGSAEVSASAGASIGAPPAVRARIAGSPAQQLELIARSLRERHVFDGVAWSDMAVIVRSGSLVEPLSRGLAALEVPTTVTTAGSALRDEQVVRAFVLALDVAMGRRQLDATAAVDLLSGVLGGLDPISLRRLRSALRREELAAGGARGADELLVEALDRPGGLATIDTATARRAARLAESVRAASAEAAAGATIEELLWGLWQRSGLERTWTTQAREPGIAADEADRHLDVVVALFASAQRFVERAPLAPPALFLDELTARDVAEDTLAPRAVAQSVTVSTPTGVVGRDFEIVVVAGVQENVWPDMRVRGTLLGSGDLPAAVTGASADTTDARTAVLHDELRLFAQAVSRSRRELLVTAVSDEDQAPSAFFSLLPEPDDSPAERHPLSLRGLTARLRRTLTTETDPLRSRQAAFDLARLAAEDVAGADPVDWYGIADISTELPLHHPDGGDGPVRVSPSRMEAFETCELHWLIDQLGGSAPNTASSLGSIIHSVAEHATPESDITPDGLLASVRERWEEIPFESEWQSGLESARAAELTERLSAYLRDFRSAGGELVQAEGGFSLPVGDAAVLNGKIDRVELRGGLLYIVDLKTGRSEPTSDDAVAEHAQLGAYQLAYAAGALGELPDAPLGGARLVVVSSGTRSQPWRQPTQAPLDDEQLAAFQSRVEEDARRMGGTTFIAQIGSHCVDPYSHGSCRIHIVGSVSS
ncbi:ATP-dependent DNA helicase [Leifsonia sp. Root1293]|nr:ATP-dependent DNA helicase [Leifsonia sp. Root1293]KRA12742.1 ATP-dependent DNA helicase [Leifsonia sp. Root60]